MCIIVRGYVNTPGTWPERHPASSSSHQSSRGLAYTTKHFVLELLYSAHTLIPPSRSLTDAGTRAPVLQTEAFASIPSSDPLWPAVADFADFALFMFQLLFRLLYL